MFLEIKKGVRTTNVQERIRRYIASRDMPFRLVARRAGIDDKKFYRLMDGTTRITVDDYETICRDGLQIDPGYFFNHNVLETKNTAV